jgi:hypothetical protein
MTVAVGDSGGHIQIYEWTASSVKLTHKSSISYDREYKEPVLITFSFFHGSQLLLIGSELNEAVVINLATQKSVARLVHQGKGITEFIRAVFI